MQKKYTIRCIVLAVLLCLSACAKRPPETRAIHPSLQDPVQGLRSQFEQVLSNPAFDNAFWGIAIQSLDNGQLIYERNSEKLLMPASNMKLITAAAALKRLGSNFQYQTTVQTDGSITNGTLEGNLVIVGSGDPTISARFGSGNHFSTFENWTDQLKSQGIYRITGDVIGIDDRFDAQRIGYGWSWDDLPYYYATETAALQFAENAITVTLAAGQTGAPVVVQKEPETAYINVVQNITVQPDTIKAHVDWSYDPESKTVFATGTLPPNGQDYGSFSVHNPAAYFATALKETLQRNGITVEGDAYRAADRWYKPSETTRILIQHQSPLLREILGVLLKVSQNLYAETLLKTLGNGTFSDGIKEVEKVLLQIGVAPKNFLILDGSGLSRYNYVTPSGLMQLLNRMHVDPEFETFFNALAIAGVDGTLRYRMKDTTAQNNVHAKTGSLSNVRSLSGYARTRDGEWMAFVMIANNFSAPTDTVQYAQDVILQQLTNFTRTRSR